MIKLFFRRLNFIWDWRGLQRFPPCKFITDYMATTFTLNTCNVLTNSLNQVQCLCHSYVMWISKWIYVKNTAHYCSKCILLFSLQNNGHCQRSASTHYARLMVSYKLHWFILEVSDVIASDATLLLSTVNRPKLLKFISQNRRKLTVSRESYHPIEALFYGKKRRTNKKKTRKGNQWNHFMGKKRFRKKKKGNTLQRGLCRWYPLCGLRLMRSLEPLGFYDLFFLWARQQHQREIMIYQRKI